MPAFFSPFDIRILFFGAPIVIAVFAMQFTDDSTIRVMEWIKKLGGCCVRINAEQIPEMGLGVDPGGDPNTTFILKGGKRVALPQIRSVWFRRSAPIPMPAVDAITDEKLRETADRHMKQEMRAVLTGLYRALDHAHWLSHPDTARTNKFHMLRHAHARGVDIPKTLITNDKRTLAEFREKHGEIILKCVSDPDIFTSGDELYSMFTNVFEKEHIDSLPDRFFPVLVQQKIEKAWEIRSFFLDGAFYSMAIFSQDNTKTAVDFRHYDFENPNRTVPFLLGEELEAKLAALMGDLSLNTGSFDLIRGVDGRTYFLEVNPVGMFGMVGLPCNMHLRKKIAEYLIAKDRP